MLDERFIYRQISDTKREALIVWGSHEIREALVLREACRAIMAQGDASYDGAQAIIQQFREVAEKMEQKNR